jgi:pimeloyl-ACP methyl ester carboxylesterase
MSTTYLIPGAVLTEREHGVPLVHGDPQRGSISVFTREVAAPDGRDRPYLVFLQGGPGFEAARPTSPPSGWLARALADFRVLLLDQRGTGRSTPVGSVIPGATPADQAEYLTHFRADSIVRDLELIRAELGVERWSLLGQSFGGFTSLTYLSLAPEGLREVLITGGLAPVTGRSVDEVYAATWARTREANQRYHARYPGDLDRLRTLLRRLDDEDVRLPNGDRLTARRFRQTGMWLGDSAGFERLHHLLELPFASPAFLWDAQQASTWERNPIYATLHESCYADGGATRWSAHRLAPEDAVTGELLGGEHVFPWMWDDYAGLHAHREARRCWPSTPGRACTTPTGSGAQRGAGRCDGVRRRHVRGAVIGRGHRASRAWAARVDHQRVRPQRLCGPMASASWAACSTWCAAGREPGKPLAR